MPAAKLSPDDPDVNSGMGNLLVMQKRYKEAVPYLETAAKNSNSPATQNLLGVAYLYAGETEKGTAALEKVVETDPRPETLNDISYELADANASLPKALEYAEKAVAKEEKESFDGQLSSLLPGDLKSTQNIGNAWDTLGWVHFRLGHLDRAENYLHAAWLLCKRQANHILGSGEFVC